MEKPKHKLHDGEMPSDVTELRGLLSANVDKDVPGYLIQDHPNEARIIITNMKNGKTITVPLFAAKEVTKALKELT